MARRKQRATGSTMYTLADLKRMISERETVIADLARSRSTIAAELAEVEAQIHAIGGVSAPMRRGPGRPKGKRGPGRPPTLAAKATRGRPSKALTTGKLNWDVLARPRRSLRPLPRR